MANPQFDADEQAFLEETGLTADDLTALVAGAPEVPADVTERVQRRVAHDLSRRPRRRSRLLAVIAASVAGMVLVGALVSTGVAANLVQQLYRLVPGFGMAETTSDTMVLANPVAVPDAGHDMQVLGLVSNSAGTVVRMRWTGATAVKVPIAEWPWLILPDGTRLQAPGGDTNLSNGTLTWTFTFAALSGSPRSVRLELPPIAGITTKTVTVALPLTADTSGLALAVPTGNPTVENEGVRVSVPSLSLTKDRIDVAVDVAGITPDVQVDSVAFGILTDDLGNRYVANFPDSSLRSHPGVPVVLSFQGPVRDGARVLTLSLAGVTTTATGTADVSVEVGELAVGASRNLDQQVILGPASFRITRVTRTAEAEFRLDLATTATTEGYQLSSFSTVVITGQEPPSLEYDVAGRHITMTIHSALVDGKLTFGASMPLVYRSGPYVLEIPLP